MLLFNQHCIEAVRFHFHFNTSNVTIQPPDYISEKIMKENFNTSNVTIQRILKFHYSFPPIFQYI